MKMVAVVGGFTLIELMIALLVFSALGFAVSARVGDVAQQSFQLERRAIAHWVGQNQLQRLQLSRLNNKDPLTTGTRSERVFMGERDWVVKFDVKNTEQPLVNRVEVAVFELTSDGDEIGPLDQTTSFLGRY